MKYKFAFFCIILFILCLIFQLNLKSSTGTSSDYTEIKVNAPILLSYKSKQEIYDLRKNAVANSIFRNPNYEPSNKVFGQIENFKPWVSMNACFIDNKAVVTEPSEEARFILNPEILVAIEYVYGAYCNAGDYVPNIQAKSVRYSKSKNEITVVYDKLINETLSNNTVYSFKGLNARDLGYKYAYIDKSKSTYNLIFADKDTNISTSIAEFQDFLHCGDSCRHEGGCNNGSPRQPMLDFENSHVKNTPYQKNKEIYIKFWKKMPNTLQDKPDISERIIIENA